MLVKFLQAFNGDSIWINFTDASGTIRNFLIDGGPGSTYQFKNKKGKQEHGDLHKLINDLKKKGQVIDLLILTHVDDDHIGGLLKWLEKDSNADKLIKKVWFNSGRLLAEHFNQNNIEESSFSPAISSAGEDTPADVDQFTINKLKVNFRPGRELSNRLSSIQFQKTGSATDSSEIVE